VLFRALREGGAAMGEGRARAVVAAVAVLALAGCGRAGSGRVSVPELGLSMQLPAGWRVDRQNPRMFHEAANPDDNFGLVEDYPMKGETLSEHVEGDLRGYEVVSRKPVAIDCNRIYSPDRF
jgi:hypothetical protein